MEDILEINNSKEDRLRNLAVMVAKIEAAIEADEPFTFNGIIEKGEGFMHIGLSNQLSGDLITHFLKSLRDSFELQRKR